MDLKLFPESITHELIKNSLESKLKRKDFVILNRHLAYATKAGENYFSNVFRATIDYQIHGKEPEKTSIFIKVMSETEVALMIEEDIKMFDKKVKMYLEVLPKFAELSGEMFSAHCLNYIKSPSKILVLEDLCARNFKTADRKIGLDFEHCELVFKKIAQFHATSMVLNEQNPNFFDNFMRGVFNLKKEDEKGAVLFTLTCTVITDLSRNWEGFEGITRKLEKIRDNFLDGLFNCIDQPNSKIKCLNHGDLWTSNIFFKYEEDSLKPTDIKFVDFQTSWLKSIGIDWNYFWHTSPNNQVREECEELMISTYFESLIGTLKKLEFEEAKLPTLEDVKDEIRKYEFYGFVAAVGSLHLFLYDNKQKLPKVFETLHDEKLSYSIVKTLMEGESYQKAIKLILKRLDKNGTLDI